MLREYLKIITRLFASSSSFTVTPSSDDNRVTEKALLNKLQTNIHIDPVEAKYCLSRPTVCWDTSHASFCLNNTLSLCELQALNFCADGENGVAVLHTEGPWSSGYGN
jgi:hypothetical protein